MLCKSSLRTLQGRAPIAHYYYKDHAIRSTHLDGIFQGSISDWLLESQSYYRALSTRALCSSPRRLPPAIMRQSVSKSNCSSILCNSIQHKTLCTPTSAPVPNYATCWQSKANSPIDRYLRTVFFSLRQSYLQHSMSQHPPLSEALSSIKPRFTSDSEIEIT